MRGKLRPSKHLHAVPRERRGYLEPNPARYGISEPAIAEPTCNQLLASDCYKSVCRITRPASPIYNVTGERLLLSGARGESGRARPIRASYSAYERARLTGMEQPRLEAIERYGIGALPHDPALDDIARLAAQVCGTEAGLVSIVEEHAVTLLGSFGLEHEVVHGPTPRNQLPCETTIEADGVYQIPDAQLYGLYAPAGIPVGNRRFRFYAGAPVQTPNGVAIGCVCVLDATARKLSAAQIDTLESLSHMVTTRLELAMHTREMGRAARARQRVETALTIEKNFVATVLDTVGALVVVFDSAGRIVRFNRACELLSGYRSPELVGHYAWERLIPEEDIAGYVEGFERIRGGGFPTAFENNWLAADGTRRRIAWSATALLDPQAQVAFIIATGIDVTEQRVAEQAIRESEARYRQIVEGSLGLVCTHALDGTLLSINEHGARSFGRAVQEVVGHNLTEFILPERQQWIEPYFDALLAQGEAQGLMYLPHRNGQERVLAYRNRLIEATDGPRYVLAFAVDITEQVRAEDQLRTLIRQSNSVLESIGDGIYGIDLEGRVTVVNPAAAQMLGYHPEELLGRNMHELVHHSFADGTPYPESSCPIRGSVQNGTSIRVAHEVFWRKDGSSFPVEYVARPQIEAARDIPGVAPNMRAAGGGERAVGVVVAFTDISERNALDRMKDEFISTVSHELRTPLTSLRAALGLVAGGALDTRPEKAQQMMEIAVDNTERLVRLVNDILDLERIGSGRAELHRAHCSVEELFQRTVSLLGHAAARANIRLRAEPNGVTVWADPDRILQTLTNLVSNAIKFSAHEVGRSVEIRLSAKPFATGTALLEVEDQGRGIPPDKLQTIFERFRQVDATDARTMGGTGLGLAICNSIVAQHGGRIWATSTVGEGSILHFTLPIEPSQHLP